MSDLDVAPYFSHLNPSVEQLARITHEIEAQNHWWGVGNKRLIDTIAIVFAPGDLSQLSIEAFELLRRCQGRAKSFDLKGKDTDYGQSCDAFIDRFRQLAEMGLVREADIRAKLKGSRSVGELRTLLSEQGLVAKGNKDDMVERLTNHLDADTLRDLTADIVLYTTTPSGDQAISTISKLSLQAYAPLSQALRANESYLENQRPPLPSDIEPSELELTDEDLEASLDVLEEVLGPEMFLQLMLGLPIESLLHRPEDSSRQVNKDDCAK